MGIAKRKITELHRKYKKERETKREIARAAYRGLQWWQEANSRAKKVLDEAMKWQEFIFAGRIRFLEWISLSPMPMLRRIGRHCIHAEDSIFELHERNKREYERWRVEVILGGATEFTVGEIAKMAGLSVVRVGEILEAIKKDKEIRHGESRQRKTG
jgi:transcriptional accessory protein Tex/SPT6